MKRFITTLFAVASVAVATAEPTPQPPLTAAVLDFQVSGRDFEKKGSEAAILLNAKLSAAPSLILVERQEIDKILGEQELGLSGNVTPDTAAKIGQLTGAKVIVTGRVFGTDNKYYVVAKIIGTETSRVYGETVTFASPDALDGAVNELAPKILAIIEKHGDALLAKVEDPEARLERLKKLVQGVKLPSVSIQITEQHINHAVIDPAAQTEMMLVLKQAGFEVIDPATSRKQADVAVSGEAFSEMAGRHGNLISCRSRVEIKVTQTADGKLLLADRQTDVASDIAESVAGKTSLQDAALKLLDRIVPVLVKAVSSK
jgi:hypothetical protein